jgi:hypothetical protein
VAAKTLVTGEVEAAVAAGEGKAAVTATAGEGKAATGLGEEACLYSWVVLWARAQQFRPNLYPKLSPRAAKKRLLFLDLFSIDYYLFSYIHKASPHLTPYRLKGKKGVVALTRLKNYAV